MRVAYGTSNNVARDSNKIAHMGLAMGNGSCMLGSWQSCHNKGVRLMKPPIPFKIAVHLKSFDGKLTTTRFIWSDELAEHMIDTWPELFWTVDKVSRQDW